jgi:hypothetical protein
MDMHKICTKVCEDRLLTLDPYDTHLFYYKNYIQKQYRYENSSTPLYLTVSLLLRCPPMEIQFCDLRPRKSRVNNTTVSCLECQALLWLYGIGTDDMVESLTLDDKIITLTLCEPEDLVHFADILDKFPSLIKLQLIRVVFDASLFNQHISLPNLVTLSLIECDLTGFSLDNLTMSSMKNLEKLNWVNNRSASMDQSIDLIPSIHSVSITHTKPEALFIGIVNCGMKVSIK